MATTILPSARFATWLAGRHSRVAVTGASGWLGRTFTHSLLSGGAAPERLRLFGSRARTIEVLGQVLTLEALAEAEPLGEGDWLFVHLAVCGGEPETLAARNDAILDQALALAESASEMRLAFASSGAVYREAPTPYGAMKQAHEARLAAWSARVGRSLTTVRVFNVGGPYIDPPERYALGDFILSAARRGVIEIAAERPVIRAYAHGLDLARATFDALLEGVHVFDTGGDPVEMAELAEEVAVVIGLPVDIRRPKPPTGEPDRYAGDGAVYTDLLRRSGAEPASLVRIVADTAAYLGAL